jgi:hypothetical protein
MANAMAKFPRIKVVAPPTDRKEAGTTDAVPIIDE